MIEALNAALPANIRVSETLGSGGQSTVFRGERDGDVVALKLMPSEAGGRERAEREAATGFALQHPNLVEIYDDEPIEVEVEGVEYCYFTEQYVEGELLLHLGQLGPCETLNLAGDLLAAVEHLWAERRVVHRDIKPHNIVRTLSGKYVLLDVGIARHQDLSTLTDPGAIVGPGSRGYYSPEQLVAARGRELDHRSDQFQVGITCFQALTGRLPFDPDGQSYVTRLATGNFDLPASVPEPLGKFIGRLLAPEPHQRYRTADRATAAVDITKEALQCS